MNAFNATGVLAEITSKASGNSSIDFENFELYCDLSNVLLIPNRLKNWKNSSFYTATNESFLISYRSQQELAFLNMNSTNISKKKDIKHFDVAHVQGTQFSILPVHTRREKQKFMDMVKPYLIMSDHCPSFKRPPWIAMAKEWNLHSDGKTIFYKTPYYLDAYWRRWKQIRVEEKHRSQIR